MDDYHEKIEEIDKSIVGVRSFKKRLTQTNKLVNGYNQLNAIHRALGWKNAHDMNIVTQDNISLINESDVVNVVKCLIESGYTITLPKELADKDLTK